MIGKTRLTNGREANNSGLSAIETFMTNLMCNPNWNTEFLEDVGKAAQVFCEWSYAWWHLYQAQKVCLQLTHEAALSVPRTIYKNCLTFALYEISNLKIYHKFGSIIILFFRELVSQAKADVDTAVSSFKHSLNRPHRHFQGFGDWHSDGCQVLSMAIKIMAEIACKLFHISPVMEKDESERTSQDYYYSLEPLLKQPSRRKSNATEMTGTTIHF